MHPVEPTEEREREKKERERSKGERIRRIRSLGQASDPHGETEK